MFCLKILEPKLPEDIRAATSQPPHEDRVQLQWTAPTTYYSYVQIICNYECCNTNRNRKVNYIVVLLTGIIF